MSGEFPYEAVTLLNRRFFIVYWYPTLLSFLAGLLLYSWPEDWEPLSQYFSIPNSKVSSPQLDIILWTLLLTLVLAHLLQAFSHPFVQFWEGYQPQSLWNWYKNKRRVEEKWKQLKKERATASTNNPKLYASLHEQLFSEYPSRADRLLPTQLGNVLRASEDYTLCTYGMDIVFWWPRLWLILPDTVQKQIDDSQAPMLALLNFTTQIGVISIVSSIYLGMKYTGPWQLWAFLAAFAVLIAGIILTTLAYRGAVSHAKVYGVLIRSAVDTYRFDLIKALHQPIPLNLYEEKKLWKNLMGWTYLNDLDNPLPYLNDQKSHKF